MGGGGGGKAGSKHLQTETKSQNRRCPHLLLSDIASHRTTLPSVPAEINDAASEVHQLTSATAAAPLLCGVTSAYGFSLFLKSQYCTTGRVGLEEPVANFVGSDGCHAMHEAVVWFCGSTQQKVFLPARRSQTNVVAPPAADAKMCGTCVFQATADMLDDGCPLSAVPGGSGVLCLSTCMTSP